MHAILTCRGAVANPSFAQPGLDLMRDPSAISSKLRHGAGAGMPGQRATGVGFESIDALACLTVCKPRPATLCARRAGYRLLTDP